MTARSVAVTGLSTGMYRRGDQVLILDPTGHSLLLRACPDCDGGRRRGDREPRHGRYGQRTQVCETCGGWGAVR